MGKQCKQWLTLFFWAPKSLQMVTAAMKLKGTSTLEGKLWPRQHIKKQRHYFVNKGPSSQGYGFPVAMYGCESWTIKKAECQTIDAFELWCWRRLLKVPWSEKRSNQSILNVNWKDWCWSWNSNCLATWCEELTHWKRPRCWKRLRAGGEEGSRGWDG